jgi:cell division protein FtsZ
MTINLTVPQNAPTELKPRITVIGVGGAGGNAVNNMIQSNLEGVEFVVANTDAQALSKSSAERRIQLGVATTHGLGAGSRPEVGRAAAEETLDEIVNHLNGCHMVFIAAGMGGGTGSGAAPVLARLAREQGILTVGVVTKPFDFEGSQRMKIAEQSIKELQEFVDTLIIIPNQNLFRVANEKTTFADAFTMADDVLHMGVRGVTDLIMVPGLINLDFADIRAVMSEMGKAMMGTGEGDAENRAIAAAEAAISNPLLEDTSMKGARGVLINVTGGPDMTLHEVDEAANRIRKEIDADAHIIFGSAIDDDMAGKMRVSVVATGIDADMAAQEPPRVLSLTGETRPAPAPQPAPEPALEAAPPAAAEAPAPVAAPAPPSPQPQAAAAEPVPAPAPQPVAAPEAFIPPAPASTQPTPAKPDAMAEAAILNGPGGSKTTGSAPAPRPRMPSLFERVTGTGRARPSEVDEVPSEEPGPTAKPAAAAPSAAPAASPAPAAPEAPKAVAQDAPAPAQPEPGQVTRLRPPTVAAEPAKPAPQAQLGGLDASDRIAAPQDEEDVLDIPAFLRRQAN